jgi:hypothetical protein
VAVVQLLISRSLPSKGSTCHIAPSLKLFVRKDLKAYRHFFSSEGCPFDVSFVSEEADSSTMSTHSRSATRWKSRLLASRPPTREFLRGPHKMSSCFPAVARNSCLLLPPLTLLPVVLPGPLRLRSLGSVTVVRRVSRPQAAAYLCREPPSP